MRLLGALRHNCLRAPIFSIKANMSHGAVSIILVFISEITHSATSNEKRRYAMRK